MTKIRLNHSILHRFTALLLLALTGILLAACTTGRGSEWKPLFNGRNLEGFDTYLGKSLPDEWAEVSKAATTESVFSIAEIEGEKVIHISGEINGSLATKEAFENYHLRLVYKWGDTVYNKRNSGLLYHSFGEFGVAIETWMANIELQLMHGNLGDTYLMANTACDIPAQKNTDTEQWVFTPGADMVPFSEHTNGRLIRKSKDLEKPLGEWNVVDLYCFGTTAVHVVNGTPVMVNYNTATYEDGKRRPLTSGKIQIQSEGAELFIKSLDIRPIDSIPTELLNK